MAPSSNTTTNHDEIQRWVEERGGIPSVVRDTHQSEGTGVLRVDFPEDEADERLEEISWDEFFEIFDSRDLAFIYQDETSSGNESRFCKFVSREKDR